MSQFINKTDQQKLDDVIIGDILLLMEERSKVVQRRIYPHPPIKNKNQLSLANESKQTPQTYQSILDKFTD